MNKFILFFIPLFFCITLAYAVTEENIPKEVVAALSQQIATSKICGNNVCQEGETVANCPKDCKVEFEHPACIFEEDGCRDFAANYMLWFIFITIIYYFFKRRDKK